MRKFLQVFLYYYCWPVLAALLSMASVWWVIFYRPGWIGLEFAGPPSERQIVCQILMAIVASVFGAGMWFIIWLFVDWCLSGPKEE